MSMTKEASHEKEIQHDTKKSFIDDEKFQLIKHYQQAIFEATSVSPSAKRIVNDLINVENLEKFKLKLIQILSN